MWDETGSAKKPARPGFSTGTETGVKTGMDISSMEPMLPWEAERSLDDVTFELVREASMLAGRVHPLVQEAIGALGRSMNCCYSNLIEGHDTHPRDIDRALARDIRWA